MENPPEPTDARSDKEVKNVLRGEGDNRYINPDPLYHLVGPANEIESIVEGIKVRTLVILVGTMLLHHIRTGQEIGVGIKGIRNIKTKKMGRGRGSIPWIH